MSSTLRIHVTLALFLIYFYIHTRPRNDARSLPLREYMYTLEWIHDLAECVDKESKEQR